jgi:glycosidase
MKQISLVVVIVLASIQLHAQCFNMSNLNNSSIICTYGDYANPYANIGVMSDRHVVNTNPNERDLVISNLLTIPKGDSISIRLGNSNTGAEAESITFDYTVDADNPILMLKYAKYKKYIVTKVNETFFNYFLENKAAIDGKGYMSVVSGNHDLPRVSMGRTPEELKTVFAFILALPNIPLIYYGDEIGMPYTKLKTKDGGYCRTGARTPMQWSAGKNAGFSTTDGETYLPINENYTTVNSESMAQDADSLLNGVKALVEAKRTYLGDFKPEAGFELVQDEYPVVFKRVCDGKTFLCAVNPSEEIYTIDVPAGAKVMASGNASVEGDKATLRGVSYLWVLAE